MTLPMRTKGEGWEEGLWKRELNLGQKEQKRKMKMGFLRTFDEASSPEGSQKL